MDIKDVCRPIRKWATPTINDKVLQHSTSTKNGLSLEKRMLLQWDSVIDTANLLVPCSWRNVGNVYLLVKAQIAFDTAAVIFRPQPRQQAEQRCVNWMLCLHYGLRTGSYAMPDFKLSWIALHYNIILLEAFLTVKDSSITYSGTDTQMGCCYGRILNCSSDQSCLLMYAFLHSYFGKSITMQTYIRMKYKEKERI